LIYSIDPSTTHTMMKMHHIYLQFIITLPCVTSYTRSIWYCDHSNHQ